MQIIVNSTYFINFKLYINNFMHCSYTILFITITNIKTTKNYYQNTACYKQFYYLRN